MKTEFKYFAFLALFLIVIGIAVDPLGEFCLYDDWSFAKAVESFVSSGKMQLTGWTSMPLFTQVMWGSLFAWVFGFSFTVLRISTIVLSYLGLIGTYYFFYEISQSKRDSFLMTLIVLTSTVFVSNAFSFNTDAPFYSILIWSAYFFVKYLKYDRQSLYFLAIITLVAATLVRDISIALPVGFAVALLISRGINRKALALSLVPVAVVLATLIIYRLILETTQGLPYLYDDGRRRMLETLTNPPVKAIAHIGKNIIWVASYLGFYFSPVLIIYLGRLATSTRSKVIYIGTGIISGLCLLAGSIASPRLAAKFGEFMVGGVFGVTIFENVYKIDPQYMILPTHGWALAASVMAATGLALIVPYFLKLAIGSIDFIWKKRLRQGLDIEAVFCLSALIVYLAPLVLAGVYTKYLLPAVPLLLAATYRHFGNLIHIKKVIAVPAIIFVLLTYFTIATVHDSIAEERYRWQACNELRYLYGASPQTIDGGITFNGWFLYDNNYKYSIDKNWWWVAGDDYIVTTGKIDRMTILRVYPYRRYFPPCFEARIFAMKKQPR